MDLSPQSIREVDSMLEGISRQIWNLLQTSPKAGLHYALLEDIGLNILSIWEDYYGAVICSWTQILNDEGALGTKDGYRLSIIPRLVSVSVLSVVSV